MAVDSRDKRASCIGVALPVPSMLPSADGTVAAADRQILVFLYRGIAAAGVTEIISFTLYRGQSGTYTRYVDRQRSFTGYVDQARSWNLGR